MTFDQLLKDVVAMAITRGVDAKIETDHIIVREADEWVADLRFELSGERISVRAVEDDGAPLAHWEPATLFDTVEAAAEHFDIG